METDSGRRRSRCKRGTRQSKTEEHDQAKGEDEQKETDLGAAAAAILALGGGGATVAAQQAQEREQDIKGTVVAPAGSGEENETERARGLAELARINRAAAAEAALGKVPGEVREVELENESGFVVYEVEIAGQDGALHEVVVDAGSGEVIAQEVEEGA